MEDFSKMIEEKLVERKEKIIKYLEERLIEFFISELESYRKKHQEFTMPYRFSVKRLDPDFDLNYLEELIEAGKNVGFKVDSIENCEIRILLITTTDEETHAQKIWKDHQEQWGVFLSLVNSQAEKYCEQIREKIHNDDFESSESEESVKVEFLIELAEPNEYLFRIIKQKLKERYLHVLRIDITGCVCEIKK